MRKGTKKPANGLTSLEKNVSRNNMPNNHQEIKKNVNPNAGHRGRLRDRFLQGGINALLDYEIVELLLTLGTPMKDCKPMAKEAIKKFGNLKGVLDASREELQQIRGIGPSNSFGIKLFQAVSDHYAKIQIPKKSLLDSSKAVAKYLQAAIGREKEEHFVLLHLDARLGLIKEDVSVGTLNASLVHPRELFKKAIQANAAQVIVGHNHPSGDPTPSPEDVALTRRLADAAKIIGIELLDHVIVTNDNSSSLREQNLI